jgi:squalene-hopene/tetraprenyl-beta-curcumene cyclase
MEEPMNRSILSVLLISALFVAAGCSKKSAPPPPAPAALAKDDWRAKGLEAVKKGLDFLKTRDAEGKGVWMKSAGISSLVLLAHFQSLVEVSPKTHPHLWNGLNWLQSLQKPNGSIYHPQEGNSNYVTSVTALAMILSGDSQFNDTVSAAREYLISNQMTEGVYTGGFGYEDKAKTKDDPYADIVNTEFALEALRKAGLPADHAAWKRAVKYMENCQHNSEYNKAIWVSDIGEYRGGFVYHPGGASKAETLKTADGKEIHLPYGSVTYAGIKSMIYSHLKKDDPRVKAAVDWVRRHWTLEENPGFDIKRDPNLGKQGYFYYFTTFAKALHALGEEVIEDMDSVKHPWRQELVSRIVGLQNPDGSWKNNWHSRWFESHEEVATSYAVIALSFALMKS